MEKGTFGIVGLGKMGLNLALQAIDKKYQIIGFDPYTKEDIISPVNDDIASMFSRPDRGEESFKPHILQD